MVRYEQGSTLVTSNLPFNEWTEVFGSERLTGALLDRLTHHVHILDRSSCPDGGEVFDFGGVDVFLPFLCSHVMFVIVLVLLL